MCKDQPERLLQGRLDAAWISFGASRRNPTSKAAVAWSSYYSSLTRTGGQFFLAIGVEARIVSRPRSRRVASGIGKRTCWHPIQRVASRSQAFSATAVSCGRLTQLRLLETGAGRAISEKPARLRRTGSRFPGRRLCVTSFHLGAEHGLRRLVRVVHHVGAATV